MVAGEIKIYGQICPKTPKIVHVKFNQDWPTGLGDILVRMRRRTGGALLLYEINGKRKVQGVTQSQTAALPRHQEEEETDKTKQAQIEQTYESTKISSLFPKRGNRNAKRTEKRKNKITQGKRSPSKPSAHVS